MKILFVSLGNICSSPLAEGILKQKLAEKNITAVVDSAGFESYNINEPPTKQVVSFAAKKGIDISDLKCRLFVSKDFDNFDKIYVTDSGTFRDVQFFARNDEDMKKVQYLLSVVDGTNKAVPKLFLEGEKGLEELFQLLSEACEIIAKQIK